jgi:hypothetical protein
MATKTKTATVPTTTVLDETKAGRKRATKAKPVTGHTGKQKMALVLGGAATFVLALSVWEVTTALTTLTKMPLVIAALMAVGIDVVMVLCEMAVIAAPDTDAARWGKRYVGTTVGLSMLLNGLAATQHAEGMWWLLAAPVGAIMPVLVYMAFRVAGSLYVNK